VDIDILLAEADPARNISLPGHDSPAARRALDQLTRPAPPGRQRKLPGRGHRRCLAIARPLGLAGAASAAVAAGVAVGLVFASGAPASRQVAPGGGATSHAASGAPAARPSASFSPAVTAADILHNAALAALQMPGNTPRPDQFVYSKLYITEPAGEPRSMTVQYWKSVSGARFGLTKGGWHLPKAGLPTSACVNGLLEVPPGAYPSSGSRHCTAAQVAGYLPGMPADPPALAPYLYKILGIQPPGEADQLLDGTEALMTQEYLTPAQQAGLYDVLARTPGLTVVPRARNLLGTIGVGVRTGMDKGNYYTIIFNPKTYAPLGMTWQAAPGQRSGDGIGGEVLLKLAIVNKAGQLP
jgi:hypothetical protein